MGRDWPRPFCLVRHADPSQVSGLGVVASGVVWPDRRAVFRWSGSRPPTGYADPVQQLCMFDDVDEISAVHGHGGATDVEVRDPMTAAADLELAVFGIVAGTGLRRRVTFWGVAWSDGPAVTWRADPDRSSRIELWPDGAASAWLELRGDTAAGRVRLAWVPDQAADLVGDHRSHALSGGRVVTRRGDLQKSPH